MTNTFTTINANHLISVEIKKIQIGLHVVKTVCNLICPASRPSGPRGTATSVFVKQAAEDVGEDEWKM